MFRYGTYVLLPTYFSEVLPSKSTTVLNFEPICGSGNRGLKLMELFHAPEGWGGSIETWTKVCGGFRNLALVLCEYLHIKFIDIGDICCF